MNKDYKPDIQQLLKQQPQLLPPEDGFDRIMDQVHQHKRTSSRRLPMVAAAAMAGLMLWLLPQINSSQVEGQQLALLTEKIAMIEQVVRSEVINHSAPGSQILEKMVSMETWLDQLDQNIAQTNDPNHKLKLLHAKLEVLDDLVALQKKYRSQHNNQLI